MLLYAENHFTPFPYPTLHSISLITKSVGETKQQVRIIIKNSNSNSIDCLAYFK